MSLPEVLYSRRKELGLTLKEIAEMVDVSEATVQRWESGNIKNLRQDKIYYFIVKGDSMMPDIHPGDLALVRLQDEVECGEQAETFYPKRDMRNLMSQMAKHAIENNYFDKNYAQYIKLPEMAFITGIHTVLPSRSNASLSLRKERS